jgi:multidrug efflux pump subunit AcrA (membrane-fusion protein)
VAGHHQADDHLHDEDVQEHVSLTRQAFQNLGLKLEKVTPRDYWKSQTVPGAVVEIPGRSKLTVSAPVTGVIDSVLVSPGQTVIPADPLFTLRITDESLTAAQSKWLAGIARREIVEKEIARLAPLTSAGAVAGRRKRDLEYELAQLDSAQQVLEQDMLSRGLPAYMITRIAEGRSLASTLEIVAPPINSRGVAAHVRVRPVSLERTTERANYSVSMIQVHAGQTVQRGDALCTLDNHAELYVRGQAFDSDLPLLDRLTEKGWKITAEFGHDHDEPGGTTIIRRDLPLLRIDNVVGAESQTFTFFLPLRNEIAQTLNDEAGRSFVHWRFKPGQRVHLRIPAEHWQDQIVLPLDAVVLEGPHALVFVEHTAPSAVPGHSHDDHSHDDRSHDDHSQDDHSHDDDQQAHEHPHPDPHQHAESDAGGDVFIELEAVPVQLLHRDERFAVIANDGQITSGRRVALNSAYELQQAMRMQQGGSGSHPHAHEH